MLPFHQAQTLAMQFNPYVGALALSALVSLGLVPYVWARRATRSGAELTSLLSAVSIWTTAAACEAASTTVAAKIAWSVVAYLGNSSAPVFCLLFALRYTERAPWLEPRHARLLLVVPALSFGMAATNGWHHLLWRDVTLAYTMAGIAGVFTRGPWFWINVVYCYVLVMAAAALLVWEAARYHSLFSRQSRLMAGAMLFPFAGNAAYILAPARVEHQDLGPIAFVATSVLLTLALFRYRLLDLVPFARGLLFENLRDGVIFLDRHRQIVDVNAAAQAALDLPRDAVGQRADIALARWGRLADFSMQAGEAQMELLAPGSSDRWFEVRIVPLRRRQPRRRRGDAGRPGDVVGHALTLRDLTARRRAEQAVAESEERLRIAALATGQIIYDHDLETGSVTWAGAVEALTGYSATELGAMGIAAWEDGIHHEDRQQALTALGAAAATEADYHEEYRFRCRDGRYIHVEDTGAFVRDERGRVRRIVGAMKDVTERREAEQARLALERQMQQAQKLESLGVLAGGIAHDFNNLLMAVMGQADLARAILPAHSPVRESLDEILTASRRASELCRQMLAYSGRGRFVVEDLDLNDLVREMAHLLRTSISKKATLHLDLAATLPLVRGDATQLRQIVMNLITNASEALGEANGSIELTTGIVSDEPGRARRHLIAPASASPQYVTLEVTDSGCGMDAPTMARIFDPFFSTKFTGRGLGLAAVSGIVRGHNGALDVSSRPGAGTTFRVFLPASVAAAATRAPAVAATLPAPAFSGTVLLVDDEEPVRLVARKMLEHLGFDVITAANGAEAVEVFRARHGRLACVVLDLTMPLMDGDETLEAVHAIDATTPVILASGYSVQELSTRFAGRNIAGFLQKPFELSRLREALQRLGGPAPGVAA